MLYNAHYQTFENGIVCFPLDEVIKFAQRLGLNIESFIECYDGVKFAEGRSVNLHEMIAIHNDGDWSYVYTIGLDPENFQRFFREDEGHPDL